MNVQSMTKKAEILAGTMALIALEGVNDSPMSKIAKNINVAVGTIYHYFKSKEEIINEIYHSIKKNVGDVIVENAHGDADYKQEFKKVTLAIYNYYKSHPVEYSFLLQVEHSPIITAQNRAQCDGYFAPVFDFYQKGIDEGVLVEMDLMVMGILTYNIILSMLEFKIRGMELSDEQVDQSIEFSWRAIAKNDNY